MTKSNKFILSDIIIPYGDINTIPKAYTDSSGTKISFTLVKNNQFQIRFDFENSSIRSEIAANNFARDETYRIAYFISLNDKINTECFPCHMSSWDNQASVTRNVTASGKISIALPINIQLKINDNLKKFETALEFFNKALYYKEKSGKSKEVAFWLYHAHEALQMELYGKKQENKLKSEVLKLKLIDKKRLDSFKNSIGRYYRHYEIKLEGEIMNIKTCVDIFRRILNYFVFKN